MKKLRLLAAVTITLFSAMGLAGYAAYDAKAERAYLSEDISEGSFETSSFRE